MRHPRLFWLLFPTYLTIVLASLAVVTWYASRTLRASYQQQAEIDLEARARLLRGEIAAHLRRGETALLEALCKQRAAEAATRITVILPDGKVIADSDKSPADMENHADRPEVIGALAGNVASATRHSHTLHEDRLYVAVPIIAEDKPIGVLRTSISLDAFEEAVRGVQRRVILGGVATAVLAGAISWLLVRRITRPLEHLQQGAARFARGELHHRLPVPEIQEFTALAEALNQMAAELDSKLTELIRERNERDAILSSMVEAVLAFDSQQRLIRCNWAAAELMGIDTQRALGRPLPEVIRNAEIQRLVAEVLRSGKPAIGEVVLIGESQRVLQLHGTVLHGDAGNGGGVLIVSHDVTELKKLERVRRDFVANVSHELRTPVTSIKGFVETLLDGAMHEPERLQRFLDIVASQTNRLNAIIEDLLTLSRLEQEGEQAEIALVVGQLHNVLDSAIEVCRQKATEKNIHLELTCSPELQAAINAPLLEQAVINLIDNAVKYSPPGQTVHIEATSTEQETVISVRDHGCGIGREHLPRVFERFYRVDKARGRKLGGTGLGLSIVKHIAQVHGGRATVESTLGQGSTFFIHLPKTTTTKANTVTATG
jgi:two-component system phosphate regulon sensor histidine kinase PhoR